jgi:hypothetical protein
MAWYDWLPGMNSVSIASGLTGNGWSGSQSLKDAYAWGQKRPDVPAPQVDPNNPYTGGYNGLIQQLQQQSTGAGPSLAGNAYREAHDQGMNDLASAGHGGSAGSARTAQLGMSNMTAGLSAGYSNARLQEQLAARQQLQAALSGASAAYYTPQLANQSALLEALKIKYGQQTNGQQLTGTLQQLGQAGGQIASMG